VIVPDFQLSLAIGKEGQNARLAARLTGWRIDIRSDADPRVTGAGPASHTGAGPASHPGAGAASHPGASAAPETGAGPAGERAGAVGTPGTESR